MIFKTVATYNPNRSCTIQILGYEAVMENKFNAFFFKSGSSDRQHSENKISWRRYALILLFAVILMSLILVGIFCSSFLDSMISLFVLAIIAIEETFKGDSL